PATRLAQLSLFSLAQGPRSFRLSIRPAMYVAARAATTKTPIRTKSSLNAREKPISAQTATAPTTTRPQLSALTTPSAGVRGLAHEGRRQLVQPGQAESADCASPPTAATPAPLTGCAAS